jgi:hypothetical protein
MSFEVVIESTTLTGALHFCSIAVHLLAQLAVNFPSSFCHFLTDPLPEAFLMNKSEAALALACRDEVTSRHETNPALVLLVWQGDRVGLRELFEPAD